jgi:hypothetical protein
VAATAPLFVGSDGERITRGTLQCRVLRANADVSVYTLMKLLDHESPQRSCSRRTYLRH